MADFPTSLFEIRETQNLPGIVYDPADKKNLFSEDIQNIGGEITAIEEVLGLNPQASYDTVAEFLLALEAGQFELTAQVFGTFVNSLTSKTTVASNDRFVLMDSEDSNKAKKISLTNLYSALFSLIGENFVKKSEYPGLVFQSSGFLSAPADSTTYWLGGNGLQISTTKAEHLIPYRYIQSKIQQIAFELSTQGTLSSTENASLYITVNSTDHLITNTFKLGNSAQQHIDFSSLDIDVDLGDDISIKIVTPAWATNPTFVWINAYMTIVNYDLFA